MESCSMKINYLFCLLSHSLTISVGSVVLCYGVCKRRRPDVSDPALTKVWWSSFPFLRSWGHISTYVPAPTRRHLQVYSHRVEVNRKCYSEPVLLSYFHHFYEWLMRFTREIFNGKKYRAGLNFINQKTTGLWKV